MDADPSIDAIDAPFTAAMHHYLRGELGSKPGPARTRCSPNTIKNWSFEEFQGKPINVADKLERLTRANPTCGCRIEYGYSSSAAW